MSSPVPHRFTSSLIAFTLATLVPSAPARAINAVLNDNFISGTDPWSLNIAPGATAALDNDSGWGRVTITNGGTSKSTVNLDQVLTGPLVNGVTYTISFDARASVAKSVDVLLRGSSTIYHGSYGVSVGTTSTRKTITYTHTQATVADAKLSFRLGGNLATFFVDNVVVTRQGASSQLLTKNNGVWEFNTLSVGGKSWNAGTYDFSYVGYNYGERESLIGIPANTQTISAVANEDITDKLNAALAALPTGGTVIIPAGTFKIGTGKVGKAVTVSKDNTVIKGAGTGLTTLQVDASYHPLPLTETESERQEETFSSGAITFFKSGAGGWFYGTAPSNAATVSATVPLGARTITISDPSGTLNSATGVVIRQIMWQSFVAANAYNSSQTQPYRWSNYTKDGTNIPLFSDPSYSFCYYRKILSRSGNTLTLDAPIPHELVPANSTITVTSKSATSFLQNCGLQDLTMTAEPEQGVAQEDALGCSVQVSGVLNGLFKNVDIQSFRSLAFSTVYPVNTSFLNCTAANAQNCGGGGSGYGFYIRGQNLLYKNCDAENLRHGYTTAASQTCNIVIKNCTGQDYRFNTDITTGGESVDDTHLQYAHGLLWDNHYAKNAGLLMIPRKELSPRAFETAGWGIVWNYENEGVNGLDHTGKDVRHNLIGITPTEFGLVIGAHAGEGANGIRVKDGYTRENTTQSTTDWGINITTSDLQVGTRANRVLYENTGLPVAESLYDIMFAQRAKLLP